MSISSDRNVHAYTISEHLDKVTKDIQELERQAKALREAKTIMSQGASMPHLREPQKYVLEFNCSHPASVEKGHCSTCGGVSMGWTKNWTACPLCGNPITAERESIDDQGVRHTLESIAAR